MGKMSENGNNERKYVRMTAEEREAEAAILSAAAESGENADANKNGSSAAQKEEIKPEFSRKFILYILKKGFVRYFIDAFTGMSQGLFCTLIAGTILGQIGTWITSAGTDAALAVGGGVTAVANIAKMLMGAGIGIGIAHSLKAPKLVMFTGIAPAAPGNPIGSYVVSVLAVELGRQVAGKTKVDIVVVPLVMFVICLFAVWAAWPFIQLVNLIGEGVALATAATPAVMGIVIAAVMGILLTLPTSSAAIWLAVASPVVAAYAAGEVSFATYDAILLAGGAAMVGCSAHMVGFAVQSFRENKWGGLIAQGIGTSMLQIPNLMRHPQIMVPPIIASIIVGPLSTCVFGLRCNAVGGGMGTSGLVGIFGAIDASVEVGLPEWKLALGIVFCCFVIPAVVCFAVSELMRKLGWIKYGDQSLSV